MISANKRPVITFSPVQVSRKDEIAAGVFVIRFPRIHTFRAGQVVAVRMHEGEDHRLYSIASGEADAESGILFDLNPEGLLTPRLAAMNPGEILQVSQPFGFFTDDERPAWWIATGTGIAPFYSMFNSLDTSTKTLIHGGRANDSFYFQKEFFAGLGERYIRCSSTAKGDGIYPGRLTAWLKDQKELDPELRYFLCGNAEMVVDVRDYLISRGVPFTHVRAEIYF